MQKRVFQLLVDNTSGVLSRISGLFSRRGYNIESITAGVTADPRFTRITIVTSGDEDILEQIFVPFFTTKESGSGIGLSLSRQIMRLHGGSLQVRSTPGKETVFSMIF